MKFKVLPFCFLALTTYCRAQVPVIGNQNTIGGTAADDLRMISGTSDGGTLLVGTSNSGISGDKTIASFGSDDYWIVKTDVTGSIEWQTVLGGTGIDEASSGEQTSDGGYIIGGTSSSGISGNKTGINKGGDDYWIVKLNSTGAISWQQTIGGSSIDELSVVHQLPDGSYIVGGRSKSGISGNKTEASKGLYDYWVLKLDNTGNIVWQNTVGSASDDNLVDIQSLDGITYFAAGTSDGGITGDKSEHSGGAEDYWVVKLNDIGDILWENTIRGDSDDYLYSIDVTSDGGVILAGSSQSQALFDKSQGPVAYMFVPSTDYWIVKLSSTGSIDWNKTIGGGYADEPKSIIEYADGYVVSGSSSSNIIYANKHSKGYGSTDIWVVYIDFYGNLVAQTTIGGSGSDNATAITKAFGGGFTIASTSSSNISGVKTEMCVGDTDYWIVNIDSDFIEYDYTIEWQDTIGGAGVELPTGMVQHSDGSYLVGGRSNSGVSGEKTAVNYGDYDYWVVKYTPDGIVQWQKTYGGTGAEYLATVHETLDGGYILGGYSNSPVSGNKTENSSNYDFWIIKIDHLGNILWQNTIGGTSNDYFRDLLVLEDGSYMIAGSSSSGIGGDKTEVSYGADDYWLVKIDADGVITWQKTLGGSGSDFLYNLSSVEGGDILVVGYSNSGVSGTKTTANKGDHDYWIYRLSNTGTVVWEKCIGSNLADYGTSVAIFEDGILFGGYSAGGISFDKTEVNEGSWDLWLVKTDFDGNIVWDRTFGGTGYDYLLGNNMVKNLDGSFSVLAFSDSEQGGDKWTIRQGCTDLWLLRFDANGNNLWQVQLGSPSCEAAYSGVQLADDLGLYCNVEAAGGYWVVKFNGSCDPSAEICNALDDNCNGLIDDGITESISIAAGGPVSFCQGGSVVLTATYTGATVQWKKNGVSLPGATSASYTATTKGTYTCTTTSDCGTVTSSSILVNVLKNPNASISAGGPTTFCAGGSVMLTEIPSAGCSYQWYKGAAPIAGATTTTYLATTAGNYKCRVTKTATGCYKNSNAIAVSVPCREGLSAGEAEEADALLNDLSVYPNPAHHFITIESSFMLPVDIQIRTISGQLIAQQVMHSGTFELDISAWPSGVYYLQSTTEKDIIVTQFIKQ